MAASVWPFATGNCRLTSHSNLRAATGHAHRTQIGAPLNDFETGVYTTAMARERAPGRTVSKHARRSVESNDEADSNEVRLRSVEGNIFIVPKEAAFLSMKVKRMVDEHKTQPFWFDTSSKDLEKVIEFCKLTQNDNSPTVHAEFIAQLDDETLFNTMAAARDLEVKSLLDLTVHATPIHTHNKSFTTHPPPSTETRSRSWTESQNGRRAPRVGATSFHRRCRFDRIGRMSYTHSDWVCTAAVANDRLQMSCEADAHEQLWWGKP
jgi:hypothetical protein